MEVVNLHAEFVPTNWFVNYRCLPINKEYIQKELQWYIKGDRFDKSITAHASMWQDLIQPDGGINSNYGQYVFNGYTTAYILQTFAKDPTSRRAIINIHQPEHNRVSSTDIPCTVSLQFLIRNGGQLALIVTMRSQDAVYGLRNDLPAFQMFKLHYADLLGLVPGMLYLNIGSFHVYEKHFEKLSECLNEGPQVIINGFTTWTDFMNWMAT
jgi:thymidylate synthase